MTDRDVILRGIVGSRAYGLAGPDSDVDIKAVFAMPTRRFLSLQPPTVKELTREVNHPGTDEVHYEVGKFLSLALKCNPTVIELLWLDTWLSKNPVWGTELVEMRASLLGRRAVRDSYFGYALSQKSKLVKEVSKPRAAKYARHLLRLLDQGTRLYETGELQVKVTNPETYRWFAERVVNGEHWALDQALDSASKTFDRADSPLPLEPETADVDSWLVDLRRHRGA